MEEKIREIPRIQLFTLSITGTPTNAKTLSNITEPGIAYFIVFHKNSKANEIVLFSSLYGTGMDASVTRISSNKQSLTQECAMKQGLKRVIKVTKFIFSYFKRIQRPICNSVRHSIGNFFVKRVFNIDDE